MPEVLSPSMAHNRYAPFNSPDKQSKYQVVNTLGEGAFGAVLLLVDANNINTAVAMKVMDFNRHPNVRKEGMKEAMIMKTLSERSRHPNIVQYIGRREDHDHMQIYIEYVDGGELFDQIEPDIGMPPPKAQHYFKQLLCGLKFIHSCGFTHRDLKPENLFLTKTDVLKIGDFGMATMFRAQGTSVRRLKTACGTRPYTSPEVLQMDYLGEQADIWSCGIILVALLAGELPWESPESSCVPFNRWMTKQVGYDYMPWKKIDTCAISLLRKILNDDEKTRATIAEIEGHRWVKEKLSGPPALELCKRRKLGDELLLDDTMSQPSHMHTFSLVINNPKSFSQPDTVDLITQKPSQLSSENAQYALVARMTRFCVVVDVDTIMEKVMSICAGCGILCVKKASNEIHATHHDRVFVVTIYELHSLGRKRVMVDFRRSKGDGLEFKKTFEMVEKRMHDVICPEDTYWLKSQGLKTDYSMGSGNRAQFTLVE